MPSPQPVDIDWGVDHTPDGSHVVLIANTFQGQAVFFLNFQFVQQLLDAIIEHAAKAQGLRENKQLLIPANVVFGPDGQPLLMHPADVTPTPEAPENPPLRLVDGGGDGD